VGERVLTEELAALEQEAAEASATAVDPATWRKVTLHLESAEEEDGFVDIMPHSVWRMLFCDRDALSAIVSR